MTSISAFPSYELINSPERHIGAPFDHHSGFDHPNSDSSMTGVMANLKINAARDALSEVVDPVDDQAIEEEAVVADSVSKAPSFLLTPEQAIVRDQMTAILVRQEVMRRRY